MTVHTNQLAYMLLQSETSAIRFWFGLTSLFFGIFFLASDSPPWDYVVTYLIMEHHWWGIGFLLSGAALLYGSITSQYNKILMFFESILGTTLWVSVSVSSMMSQGGPGAITIAALMSIWLLIRYPEWRDPR